MMIIPPVFLYAETHYRFKYFFSLYKKAEPEIIADGPYRLDPGRSYPVLILIKDAHLYPAELLEVRIILTHRSGAVHEESFSFPAGTVINEKYWYTILDLPFSGPVSDLYGMFTADVQITTKQRGRIKRDRNNNHRFTSKKPLAFYRSKTHLPSISGWIYGDAHTHSTYTEDQVEFGSPVSAGPKLCRAMGLSFFGVTDHSYDLDDRTDNYLLNDPAIPKWHAFQEEVDAVNAREKDFAVLRGEEVSCTNANGNNVHYLIYGNKRFFHGSGDGGEKWFKTKSEFTIPQILEEKEELVVTFASHPTEEVPLLQQLLLKRDEWSLSDMTLPKLHGIQILNGDHSDAFLRGMDIWKWMLNRGIRKFLLAGNDAHGNFNRFVQISIPMLSFREKDSQLFGRMKTAALVHTVTERNILDAIAAGRSVITNGPLVTFSVETDGPDAGPVGSTVHGSSFVVKLHAASTEEFGHFHTITVIHGVIGKGERTLFRLTEFTDSLSLHTVSDWYRAEFFSYIRVEATTHGAAGTDRTGFCYTNPIWIQPK
ncbi:MAG: CehA/McbA family metallohydrolase [Bacteroidetes bacterium]|nr:CehA/McbA family metallohydrolase [Bacteroidota bacterium]